MKTTKPKENKLAQLAGTKAYSDCFSAEKSDPTPTSVLFMTLNNVMVRFQ